jgi:hypothetical protein
MAELITRKESKRYPGLFVKKYSRKVFFDALWNESDELLEARGHVEDADGNIVIRPFTKIFNHGENNTDIDIDEMVVAVNKINGFMAAATYVPSVGDVVVSTTGSLDSPYVTFAEEYINARVKEWIRNEYHRSGLPVTYMFEICHPEDPHIVKEASGAYLIGARFVNDEAAYFSDIEQDLELALDMVAGMMDVLRPSWNVLQFGTVVEWAKQCKHEGYVVYGQTSRTALKIKSPYYLILKLIARKKDVLSLDKKRCDEEYYSLIEHVQENINVFNELDEQARLEYMISFLENNR